MEMMAVVVGGDEAVNDHRQPRCLQVHRPRLVILSPLGCDGRIFSPQTRVFLKTCYALTYTRYTVLAFMHSFIVVSDVELMLSGASRSTRRLTASAVIFQRTARSTSTTCDGATY